MSSRAKETKFCAEVIEFNGRKLWIDGNAKITAGNGSYEDPAPNAFSLVQVADCPWRTPTCEASCYVHGLEEHASGVHDLYKSNSRQIREILSDDGWEVWATVMGTWINRHCRGGFRWHVSGDVFSAEYGDFIAAVCKASPDVEHWIYTRSIPYIPNLMPATNLAINISTDRDNYAGALEAAYQYGLRLCYLSSGGEVPDSLREGDVIFPDYDLRGRDLEDPREAPWWQSLSQRKRRMICPVDFFGASKSSRCGVCRKCMR